MTGLKETDSRAAKVADILRPLGRGPLSKKLAVVAANLLGVHWTTVYRLRRKFLANPVASAVAPKRRGPSKGDRRLGRAVDTVIDEVVHVWLPTQRQLAHPATDLVLEVRRRCELAGLQPPSRTTIGRRWAQHREADALKRAALPEALTAPGSLVAKYPLEIVQVDHTQADVVLVSEYDRKVIGRPWLTIALDVATRCVLSFYVGMDRPGAATVGLLLTRAALSKAPWLANRGGRRVADAWNSASSPSRQCGRIQEQGASQWVSGIWHPPHVSSSRASSFRWSHRAAEPHPDGARPRPAGGNRIIPKRPQGEAVRKNGLVDASRIRAMARDRDRQTLPPRCAPWAAWSNASRHVADARA